MILKTITALCLAGVCLSTAASAQESNGFVVYGYIVYRDASPGAANQYVTEQTEQRYGMVPIDLVYESRLLDVDKASPHDAKINAGKIDAVAKDALKRPHELVALDMESWNRFDVAHSPGLYLQVLDEFKKQNPTSKVGLYGIAPQVTYGWSEDVPGKYGPLNAHYANVAAAVDYYSPSLYNWERAYADADWERAAKYAIDASRKYDASKQVIPYVTPEVTRNGVTTFLTYEQMLFRLRTLKRLGANGCILWTGTESGRKAGGVFDPQSGWAKAVVDFRAEASHFENTLLPQPSHVAPVAGVGVRIDSHLSITMEPSGNPALSDAAHRLQKQLVGATGVWFKNPWETQNGGAQIVLEVKDPSKRIPSLGMDESYQIVANDGKIRIEAATLFGLERATATLLQLVQVDSNGYYVPAVSVQDAPRFLWRGLLLDPVRHFLPVDVIERTLDAMAAVKLNVLHFHLTDNQGFRVESKLFPEAAKGGHAGEFYSQEQIRHIVAYAAARGIRVVPEFDIPGHTTSWFVEHPELASASATSTDDRTFGVHDEAMDPTKESTYSFLDAFFGEMEGLFPDEYVHIGGDETTGKAWLGNPAIVSFMKAHGMEKPAALQAYFNQRVHDLLAKHGKKMVGWDEVLDPALSSDVVIQNWHGGQVLPDSMQQGRGIIYSKPYYLDHGVSAEDMYLADPVPAGLGLTPREESLILGGEACMWGEQVTDATVESRLWPRTGAFAERLWSPASVTDVNDLYRRLAVESLRLDAGGSDFLAEEDRLLRQVAGEEEPESLKVLAAAVEPLDFHHRAMAQQNTVDTPMNGFVDSVAFDPPLRHDLALAMKRYLQKDPATYNDVRVELQRLFASWQNAGTRLAGTSGPRLEVVHQRAQQLADLGRLGLAALAAKEAGQMLSADKSAEAASLIKAAGSNDASMVRFVVVQPMAELFGQTQAQSMGK